MEFSIQCEYFRSSCQENSERSGLPKVYITIAKQKTPLQHYDFVLVYSADAKLYDYVRAEIGDRMVDRMYDLTKECKTIAEIGCGRGFIANHELPEGIEQFYLCDSSEVALKHASEAAKPDGYEITALQMDEEVPKVGGLESKI